SYKQCRHYTDLHSFPTRRSSDLETPVRCGYFPETHTAGTERRLTRSGSDNGYPQTALTVFRMKEGTHSDYGFLLRLTPSALATRSEEHTSELQSLRHLVCRLLLE